MPHGSPLCARSRHAASSDSRRWNHLPVPQALDRASRLARCSARSPYVPPLAEDTSIVRISFARSRVITNVRPFRVMWRVAIPGLPFWITSVLAAGCTASSGCTDRPALSQPTAKPARSAQETTLDVRPDREYACATIRSSEVWTLPSPLTPPPSSNSRGRTMKRNTQSGHRAATPTTRSRIVSASAIVGAPAESSNPPGS